MALQVGTFLILVLQMRKLKLRVVKKLAQHHTASRLWSQVFFLNSSQQTFNECPLAPGYGPFHYQGLKNERASWLGGSIPTAQPLLPALSDGLRYYLRLLAMSLGVRLGGGVLMTPPSHRCYLHDNNLPALGEPHCPGACWWHPLSPDTFHSTDF